MLISPLNIILYTLLRCYGPKAFKQLGINLLGLQRNLLFNSLDKICSYVITLLLLLFVTGFPRPAKIGVLVHANHGPNIYKDTKP
jgi:hypothetical protein